MPKYDAVINSAWSVNETFDYMSDFSNARYWDPSVLSAQRLGNGELALDTEFELTVHFAGREKVLRYRVTELERPSRVVFTSMTDSLLSRDALTFESRSGGSLMNYHAELRLKGVAVMATPLLAAMFRPIGDRARDSLQRILGEARDGG
jgi:Polyketide cyclase / dehydrase and lipid transport